MMIDQSDTPVVITNMPAQTTVVLTVLFLTVLVKFNSSSFVN